MIIKKTLSFSFFEKLTHREKEILKLISLGKEIKEISDDLNISAETVKTHRKNMLKKSVARNMFELVAIYSRNFGFHQPANIKHIAV